MFKKNINKLYTIVKVNAYIIYIIKYIDQNTKFKPRMGITPKSLFSKCFSYKLFMFIMLFWCGFNHPRSTELICPSLISCLIG